MSRDNPLLGILLMIGFCAFAPLGDSMAKLIGAAIPLGQVLLVRSGVQALILWPLCRRAGHSLAHSPRIYLMILLRCVLQVAGFGAMVLALRFLPLADAIAIAYVMPFLLLLMGWFFLGEHVGIRRLLACMVGFSGTLMVMQPSFAEVGWPAALPLLVAVIFSCFMLVTRQLGRHVDPLPLQALTGLMGTALLFPVILLADGTGWAELDPVEPTRREIVLLALLGLLATISHLLMAWSLRFAPAATVAPIQYSEIPFAALYGWLIFDQFPDGLALVGIGVVMSAGLYIIWRERIALRAQARPGSP
ncbi:DMT family transporter [Tropicimonas sp. TH_r6]|uniref:DMT family transporter n=1 Tax=Tropicimonas sp. TH_r6 TaxID=3082085 RepID=UPI002954846D|nr:DMT family transporter [Tropicimonas sp. TH_r6]MDV7144561.1 DMT family transporter [Tropicimonas sp. TH_r6]